MLWRASLQSAAQGSSGLLEAAPPTTEMKFKTKFPSPMLKTQKVARRGMTCGYIIFVWIKNTDFTRNYGFMKMEAQA